MKLLAITPGDPNGIGPEILVKILKKKTFHSQCQFVVFGSRKPYEKTNSLGLFFHGPFSAWDKKKPILISPPKKVAHSREFSEAGYESGWSIEQATRFVLEKKAHALVTGPISKKNLNLGGYPYPGHTEFLAKLGGCKKVTMMLANSDLRVSLVTTHLSLSSVSKSLKASNIEETIDDTYRFLKDQLGIKKPKIAVMGLNPHGGEEGLFGNEERKIIRPAILGAKSRLKDCIITGPHPSDTFFAKNHLSQKSARVDAAICMYHDQGLIPVKLLDFPNTVNITLGLPFIRTSVDHGVGFDIAGKGIADSSSFQAAIRLALKLRNNGKASVKKGTL